jgi:hypothetical protein
MIEHEAGRLRHTPRAVPSPRNVRLSRVKGLIHPAVTRDDDAARRIRISAFAQIDGCGRESLRVRVRLKRRVLCLGVGLAYASPAGISYKTKRYANYSTWL